MNKIVRNYMEIPDKINLEIYDQNIDNKFIANTNTIRIGYWKGYTTFTDKEGYINGIPGYKKSPRLSRAILAHEYAHALLNWFWLKMEISLRTC